MSASDKTYINQEQYREVKLWWLETRKKQIKELGAEIYLYPFSYLTHETYDNGYDNPPVVHYNYDPSESDLDIENMGEDSALWNTTTKQNFWIAKNCPFDFIQIQIRKKLATSFYQDIPNELSCLYLIDLMSFKQKDYVFSITGNDIDLNFYKRLNNLEVIMLKKMLIYGTTFVHKLIYDFKYCEYQDEVYPYTVGFDYCGLEFKYRNGLIFHVYLGAEKQVHIPFIVLSKLKFPKFIHTWKKKKAKDYLANEIILSFDKKAWAMNSYDSGSNIQILRELPNYIYSNLI